MLPRSQRLTTANFERAFEKSQNLRHPLLNLRVHRRDDASAVRAAFVVPKKLGKAAFRNRVRRRLRERFRLHPRRAALRGCDLIFLANMQTFGATNTELDAALDELLKRLEAPISVRPNRKRENDTQNPGAATKLALGAIEFYQRFVSPLTPPSCRFYPTCSCYTHAAIGRFGVWRGAILGFQRLLRCGPWHRGGFDPVPDALPEQWTFLKLGQKSGSVSVAPSVAPLFRPKNAE